MKLLEFLPGVAKNTQARFKDTSFSLLCSVSHVDVYSDTYLILYTKDQVYSHYRIACDIKEAFGYVAEYGKDCQVMRLRVDNEPIVELLY